MMPSRQAAGIILFDSGSRRYFAIGKCPTPLL